MKKLILIGGGNLANKENKQIHKFIIESSKRAKPSVLYIPIASHNSQTNINNFIRCMEDFDCEVNIFNDKEDLDNNDIIFIGGGNTEYMIKEFKRLNIIDSLINHLDDKIMVGISAGAIFWFKKYYSDCFAFDNNGITNYRLLDGIDHFNAYICPHYDHENIESFNDYVQNFAIALEDNTALILDDKSLDFIKENKKKAIYFFNKGILNVLNNNNKKELYDLLISSINTK